jgi:hypothetical protein
MEKAIKVIKKGGSLRGTSDNWDLRILVELRKLVHNKDLHLMASNLIEDRVNFKELPNDIPLGNMRTLDKDIFSIRPKELKEYIRTSSILVGRINKLGKTIVQRMGPNKTIESISKVCKSVNGIKDIVDNYDKNTKNRKESSKHTTRSSFDDEKGMIEDIMKVNPFTPYEGRFFKGFPKIKCSPLRYLNPMEHVKWIEKKSEELTID